MWTKQPLLKSQNSWSLTIFITDAGWITKNEFENNTQAITNIDVYEVQKMIKKIETMIMIKNITNMQSNIEGVFLAGVVCGGLKTNKWFIENSRGHAPLIMEYILKNN